MAHQNSISRPTPWLHGLQLDRDARAGVRLCPAGVDDGIVFVRTDLPGSPEIRCCADNVESMPRWTALAQDGHWVHHTEHVLAALAFCRVDNARVELDCDRLPLMPEGACYPFVEAIRQAGESAQDAPRLAYRLKEAMVMLDDYSTAGERRASPSSVNGRYVAAIPADHLSVLAVFHWSHVDSLPVGVAEFDERDSGASEDLLRARSYLVATESAQVSSVLGPAQYSVLRLFPSCPPALAMEAARHKIVDFVGDMMVLGRPLLGSFAAIRAGHRIHNDLVKRLVASDLLALVETADAPPGTIR